MKNLNFDTGVMTFSINGDESKVIAVNVKDTGIIQRAFESQKEIEKLQTLDEYKLSDNMSSEDKSSIYAKLGDKVKEQINYIFGSDIANTVFGSANPLSPVKGKPMFEHFLEAILPEIEKNIKSEQEKSQKLINEYMSKVKEFK